MKNITIKGLYLFGLLLSTLSYKDIKTYSDIDNAKDAVTCIENIYPIMDETRRGVIGFNHLLGNLNKHLKWQGGVKLNSKGALLIKAQDYRDICNVLSQLREAILLEYLDLEPLFERAEQGIQKISKITTLYAGRERQNLPGWDRE